MRAPDGPTLARFELPLPVRAANATAASLRRLGLELAELSIPRLRLDAQELAQADDFGDGDFEAGLAAVVASAERDAGLSLVGRLGVRDAIVNALANRLLRVRARRQYPATFTRELRAPLIVLGLPRSGTTLLHRLLALAPEARALRYWEVRRPLPTPGKDDRRAWGQSQQRAFKWLARGLDAKHASGAEAPEECLFLFDSSLVSSTFWIAGPLYGYLDWYMAQDQRAPYQSYREYLQLFQRETPERRLTLKAPIHTAHVAALHEAVPEAKLVQLHRAPSEAVSSANSLFYTLHRVVTEELDLHRLGRANLELFARGMEQLLAARRTLAEGTICDVYYTDLVRDPLGTVRRVREHFGFSFDDAFAERIARYMRENPQHKHGQHRYAAPDFGLSEAEITARFTAYIDAFPGVRRSDAL